jgi:hypothetical protein
LSDDYQKISDIPVIDTSVQDKIGPTLDSQHTSLDNVLNLLVKDKYTRDTFKGISGFQGVVLRVITEPKLFEYSSRTEILNPKETAQTTTKYKVWVLGPLYSIFVQPETYDETPEDKLLIDALPDFSISKNIDSSLSVGEIVWVSFGNTSNFKDPIIQYTFFPTQQNTAGQSGENVGKPSGAFAGGPLPPNNTPVLAGNVPPSLQANPSANGWVISPVEKAQRCIGNVDTYNRIINQFGIKTGNQDSNYRYVPKIANGKPQTYCNIFVWDVCCAYGAKYPYWLNKKGEVIFYEGFTGNNGSNRTLFGQPGNVQLSSVYATDAFENNANGNYDWMINNASKNGWREVDAKGAQEAANKGFLTIGLLKGKPRESRGGALGAGHAWIIRPTPDGKVVDGAIYISQAGARCTNGQWWSPIKPIWKFYTVDCPENKP